MTTASPATAAIDAFIARWSAAGGSERANYQLFIGELCELLELPKPDPAADDHRDNAYVFERRVVFRHGDGSSSNGFIDCYRRAAFVLEAKKLKAAAATVSRAFDDAMQRARGQAESYARALPAEETRPPFLVVVDVGNVIELYAEFSRSGATYTPFPDPRSHRIRLADLREAKIRERLRAVWLAPLDLDPTRATAKVTREIAAKLAGVARALEAAGHGAESVASFLTRCLFSMFAEDVGLLPKRAFRDLLESLAATPAQFVPLIGELWQAMDTGAFSVAIRQQLPRFNGKLFKQPTVLPLDREQIGLLIDAAAADWTQVEPTIFGTLLMRALDPVERHSLGAHYTPRPYVERLVLPTVVEPLREQWRNVQGAALLLAGEAHELSGKAAQNRLEEARELVRGFQRQLCELRVLDPACGSGNFLYVTLEHLKRLEGEVLDQFEALGVSMSLETEGLTVDPHQFLGLEINPRAAAIAELVLWIGYLQWHFRTRGHALPPQPVLKDFRNIECRDAVLAYDRVEFVCDERGVPLTRWDGRTTKKHPVTGEAVPDETARREIERYVNPRPAEWPQADYIVGNPPFIGNKRMRDALGDGYVEALRGVWPAVPESADFVMYWWHHAAEQVRAGKAQRFGFITTNSITQTFNRRVLENHLGKGLHLAFAIPDHPWVDSADGAAVRIAMTVGAGGEGEGRLDTSVTERDAGGEGLDVVLDERPGLVHPDLRIGANVAAAVTLRSNLGLSNRGMIPHGEGFLVEPTLATSLDGGALLKPYRNGKDLTDRPRGVLVIDTFGLDENILRSRYPQSWQWLFSRVKPERDENKRPAVRERWWLFGEQRKLLRRAHVNLGRYIVTGQTAKHRVFQFLDASVLPDDKLIAIALEDAAMLGVLCSNAHQVWALAAGAMLEDRPVYNKSACFDAFPFPAATPDQQASIRDLAEQLDAHRKRQQAAHPELTLTGLYNVLEKLRRERPLNAKEKTIHEQGLVAVLASLHAELDAAVLAAYGWSDLAPLLRHGADYDARLGEFSEAVLGRLVDLNRERAAEEARGLVRWLRPEFQNPAAGAATQPLRGTEVSRTGEGEELVGVGATESAGEAEAADAAPVERQPWPATLPEQMAACARILAEARRPLREADLAARFSGKGPWKKRLPQIIETLVALGRARRGTGGEIAAA